MSGMARLVMFAVVHRLKRQMVVQLLGVACFRLRVVGALRLDGEAEKFSFLAFFDPSAEPILPALDIDTAGIVAVFVSGLFIIPKERSAVGFKFECHCFLRLAHNDGVGRRAEAPDCFADEVERLLRGPAAMRAASCTAQLGGMLCLAGANDADIAAARSLTIDRAVEFDLDANEATDARIGAEHVVLRGHGRSPASQGARSTYEAAPRVRGLCRTNRGRPFSSSSTVRRAPSPIECTR